MTAIPNVAVSPAQATPRPLILAQRGLIAAALVLMLFHVGVYIHYALNLAAFPFDYDQGEGFELNDTLHYARGEWPYRDNDVYPFYASNYPPLYHIVLSPIARIVGPAYWYGRLLSFFSTLITAAAIAFAVYRDSRVRGVAILAGLAFLASNYVYHIGPLFRQHVNMVMLETVAVVVLATLTPGKGSRPRLILGLILLLAAGYTKQLAVATVAAVFIWLFLRSMKRAVLWAIAFAAATGALFLAINLATDGQWLLNTVTANVNQYILGQFIGLLRQFIGLHGAVLLIAVALVLYELYLDRLSLYSVWFVAAMANSVLSGKWGAGDSYFITAVGAACILAGVFTSRCVARSWRLPPGFSVRVAALLGRLRLNMLIGVFSQRLTPLIGVLCGALFVLYGLTVIKLPLDGPIFGPLGRALNLTSNTKFPHFYDSAGWTMGYSTIGQVPSTEDIANGWRIVAAVKDDPRPLLSEEAAFSFNTGKPVITNPTQLLNLYNNNALDPAALIAMIEDQAFGAVIFRARFYPPPVLEAVDRAYIVEQVIPMNGYEYTIMKPREGYQKP